MWLSVKEVEKKTGIPAGTIKRYIKLHQIIEHKFDVHYLVHVNSIETIKAIRSMYEEKRNTDYINLFYECEEIKRKYEELKAKYEHAPAYDVDDINKRENNFLVLTASHKSKSEQKKKEKKKQPFFKNPFKRKKSTK